MMTPFRSAMVTEFSFRQAAFAETPRQPGQVEGGCRHADDPAGVVTHRPRQRQDRPLRDPVHGELAHDQVARGDRLAKIGPVAEIEVGWRRLVTAGHPARQIDDADALEVRNLPLQPTQKGTAFVPIECLD